MHAIEQNHNSVRNRDSSVTALPPRGRVPAHYFAWIIWAVSVAFVLFQFVLQLSSGEMVSGLMKSFSLTTLGGGFLASTYYYVYVTLQIPAGLLMDRFGPRKLLSSGAFVVALGSMTFALSDHFAAAIAGRMLMGAGAAFAFVGALNISAKWFPIHRFGIMVATLEMIGMFGTLIGGFYLAELIQRLGWRDSIFVAAGIAMLLVVLLWTLVRDAPDNVIHMSNRPKGHFWSDVKQLLKNKTIWINALFSGLMFSVVSVFIALWAVPFLQVEHHLSLTKAVLISNLLFIGVALGSPLMSFLDARFNVRRLLLIGGGIVTSIGLFALIYLPRLSLPALASLFILIGVAVSCYVLNFIVANEISSPQTRSTSIGFTNALVAGPAPILQPLIGWVLMLVAGHSIHLSANLYTLHEYQLALTIIPVLSLVAVGLAWFIPKRRTY